MEDLVHISWTSAFFISKEIVENWQGSMSSTTYVALFTERPVEFQVRKTILKGK